MTWPFENDTSAITKKLAKKSLQSEKRRNLMVVIAVALAAFLICFTGIVSTSLTQMQRNQVVDTYEAVWLGVEENDIETLKRVPEFEREPHPVKRTVKKYKISLVSSRALLAAFYAARQSVCFSIGVSTPRLRWTRLVL